MNGSLWSIRFEFFCYLGVAFMGLVGMVRRRVLVVAACLGCLALYAAQIHLGMRMPGSRLTWLWCYPEFWPRLAADFLAGAVFYLYRERVVLSAGPALASAALLVAAAVFPTARALPLLVPPLGGYLLLYLAFIPSARLQEIARRGDLSYGVYLYAFPIQLLLIERFRDQLTPTTLTASAFVATAFMAALSWRFVERPCLRWKGVKPRLKADRPAVVVPSQT